LPTPWQNYIITGYESHVFPPEPAQRKIMKKSSVIAILFCLLAGGCKNSTTSQNNGKLDVFVSIEPDRFLVEHIGGSRVSVSVLVPAGREPHDYEPTGRQISQLGRAAVFFRTGVPFEEALIPRIRELFPKLPIIDLRRGITLLPMSRDDEEHERHEGHEHGMLDPHIWMSPELMITQALTVRDELVKLDPADAELYETNCSRLVADLTAVSHRIAKLLAPYKGRMFFVFHPTFGYFAHEFGLTQEAVEVEGKSPTAAQLQQLIDNARRQNVRIIFVQPQFSRHAAQSIANAIGGAVIPLDSLSADYLKNLNKVADEIAAALGGEKPLNGHCD